MATCNASSLLAANPFTRLDKGLQEACKLQLLCDISAGGGGGGTIGGSGTAGALAKFTAATTLGDSLLSESGSAMTLAGNQVITQGEITADTPALSITSTYNNAGVTFGGAIKLNVTDTASNAASLLMDLQVGGTSKCRVAKTGVSYSAVGLLNSQAVLAGGAAGESAAIGSGSGGGVSRDLRIWNGATSSSYLGTVGIVTGSARYLGWTSGTDPYASSVDVSIFRDAANAIAQRNSTNAQSFRVYNTYTSSTNYERGVFDWQTTANTLRIGTEKGSGGGTARDAVLVTDATERVRCDINGNVVVNTAAIATNATDGFLYVPSCAGTPTGVPTTFTGRVPIVVDTTNNKLYFYSGAAWRDAGP